MTLSITTICNECHYALLRFSFIVMLSVAMLSVAMLSVAMLGVVAPGPIDLPLS
jgi:hypothetical protein